MTDVKFSQFVDGGQIQTGDTLVGLRDGVNTKFDSPSGPGGVYCERAKNLKDVANPQDSFVNLGTGSGDSILLFDSDFVGGVYQLPVPCPTTVLVSVDTPGNTLKLPIANVPGQSFSLGQGLLVRFINTTQSVTIADYAGTYVFSMNGQDSTYFTALNTSTPAGGWGINTEVYLINGTYGLVGIISSDDSVHVNTDIDTNIIDLTVSPGSATLQTAYDNGNGEIALTANKTFSILNNTVLSQVNGVTTPSTGTNTVSNYRVLGWTFVPAIDMTVTALQYDDALFTTSETRETGIYVKSTQDLLASVSIAQTDPLDGTSTFRTHALPTPIQLNAGEEYVFATVVPSGQSDHSNADAVPDANITITQRAELPSSSTPIALSYPQSFTTISNYVHVGSFEYESTTTQDSFNVNDTTSNGSVFFNVNSTTKGAIPAPKMTVAERDAIATPTTGLTVITTDTTPPRYSVYDGSNWRYLGYLNDNVITHQLWVNAATGNDANDGGLNAPFASYPAAATAAAAIANSTNFVLINVIGDQSITGDFVIYPYTAVDQHNSGMITATGNIALDSSFTGVNGAYAYINNARFTANGLSFDYGNTDFNTVIFTNCSFPQVPTVVIQSNPAASYGGYTIFKGIQTATDTVFYTSFDVIDASVAMFGMLFNASAPSVTATGALTASLTMDNCANFGSPVVTANSTGLAYLSLYNCSPVTVSMVGAQSFLQTDNNSTSNISLSGGALLSNVNYLTQSNSLMVNSSSFTPTYYTAAAPAANVSPNSILSHLKGIDNALATIASPATTIDGMTINTTLGINGPLSPIISSHETRVGNLVTGTVRFGFNAQLNNCSITLNKSYGSAFTLTTQANGSGCVYKTPTAAIGDGIVAEVAANTTLGVSIKMVVATTGVDYIMEVNFTYEVT